MIIVPDKFVFLATPRTASRAISEALIRKYPNAITEYPRFHHYPPPDDNELPVYAVIRNPFDQILSWHNHVNRSHSVENKISPVQFASTYENVMHLPKYNKYRLNIHADIADKLIEYTDTLNKVADFFELDDLEQVGRARKRSVTDREERDLWRLIDKEFAADVKLWVNRNV